VVGITRDPGPPAAEVLRAAEISFPEIWDLRRDVLTDLSPIRMALCKHSLVATGQQNSMHQKRIHQKLIRCPGVTA